MKLLYRNSIDGVFSGIFQGLSDYTNIDPNILRFVFLAAMWFTSHVILLLVLYFIMSLLIPDIE